MIIGFILHKTIGFRVSEEDELEGVDGSEHAETGYDLGTLGASLRGRTRSAARRSRHARTGVTANHDEEVSA